MRTAPEERVRTKRSSLARLDLLKRRITVVSVLGFGALFGLAAQHTVRSSSHGGRASASRAAASAPTSYFDEHGGGYSFDDSGSQQSFSQNAEPQPPPVAQSSVS